MSACMDDIFSFSSPFIVCTTSVIDGVPSAPPPEKIPNGDNRITAIAPISKRMRTTTHPPAAIAAISPFIAAIATLTIRMIAYIAAFTASLVACAAAFAAALAAFAVIFAAFADVLAVFFAVFIVCFPLSAFCRISLAAFFAFFAPFIVRSCALVLAASLPLLYAFCTCFFATPAVFFPKVLAFSPASSIPCSTFACIYTFFRSFILPQSFKYRLAHPAIRRPCHKLKRRQLFFRPQHRFCYRDFILFFHSFA